MEINFVPAVETTGTTSSDLDEGSEHTSRPHLPYSSLPKPTEPLSISNLPIEVQSKIPNGDLKTIANLWLQLLSIQIQNGNFWKYEDMERISEQSQIEPRKATGGPPPRKGPQESNESPQSSREPESLDMIKLRRQQSRIAQMQYMSVELKRGFLDKDNPPTEDEILKLSKCLMALEEHVDDAETTAHAINVSKINEVLSAMLKMDENTGEEGFDYRPRCEKLLDRYHAILVAPVEEESSQSSQAFEIPAAEKSRKEILYLRHKLQRGFLNPQSPITEEQIPKLSGYLEKLEQKTDVSAIAIQASKIHKVLRYILKLDEIPGGEEFDLRARCESLLAKYKAILAAPAENKNTPSPPSPPAAPVEEESAQEELTSMPEIRLTIPTPEECQEFRKSAKAQDPPLDDAVVELMCILPHITFQGDREKYEVTIQAKLTRDPLEIDREVYCGGPTVPPQMAQLTCAPYYTWEGGATFVDTKTGHGIELINYEGEGDEVCTTFESRDGKHPHIETLLRTWIDNYLTMKWVPTDGEHITTAEHRSMEYLDYKSILQEFNWPHAFPLPLPQFSAFLKKMHDYHEAKEKQGFLYRMPVKWHELCEHYPRPSDQEHRSYNTATRPHKEAMERYSLLNQKIGETFRHHEERKAERAYAIRADVPFDKDRYREPVRLLGSANIGDDWRVDIEPEELLARFKDVVAANAVAVQEEDIVKEMSAVMEGAYRRYVNEKTGVWEGEEWSEVDDDSTSDYDPEEDDDDDTKGVGEDEEEVEEWESDEEDEDLDFDVVMLQADMEKNLETVMAEVEGCEVTPPWCAL